MLTMANKAKLTVESRPELVAATKEHFIDRAYARRQAGEPATEGELKGYSAGVERLLCWYLSLNDPDQARIEAEGEPLRQQYRALPIPARKRAIIPFERRTGSVLIQGTFEEGAGGIIEPRPVATRRTRRKKRGGDQEARRNDRRTMIH